MRTPFLPKTLSCQTRGERVMEILENEFWREPTTCSHLNVHPGVDQFRLEIFYAPIHNTHCSTNEWKISQSILLIFSKKRDSWNEKISRFLCLRRFFICETKFDIKSENYCRAAIHTIIYIPKKVSKSYNFILIEILKYYRNLLNKISCNCLGNRPSCPLIFCIFFHSKSASVWVKYENERWNSRESNDSMYIEVVFVLPSARFDQVHDNESNDVIITIASIDTLLSRFIGSCKVDKREGRHSKCERV